LWNGSTAIEALSDHVKTDDSGRSAKSPLGHWDVCFAGRLHGPDKPEATLIQRRMSFVRPRNRLGRRAR
jgi:hypothetical protein